MSWQWCLLNVGDNMQVFAVSRVKGWGEEWGGQNITL